MNQMKSRMYAKLTMMDVRYMEDKEMIPPNLTTTYDVYNGIPTMDILSFVIFVELLIVEVHHLEIVIGRLRAAFWSLGASQDMP